jgi:hypothetical protein
MTPDDDDLPTVPGRKKIYDPDEALAETAKGHLTEEEALDLDASEIDAMGRAAGLPGEGGVTGTSRALEQRDDERYELDPDSAEDRNERDRAIERGE